MNEENTRSGRSLFAIRGKVFGPRPGCYSPGNRKSLQNLVGRHREGWLSWLLSLLLNNGPQRLACRTRARLAAPIRLPALFGQFPSGNDHLFVNEALEQSIRNFGSAWARQLQRGLQNGCLRCHSDASVGFSHSRATSAWYRCRTKNSSKSHLMPAQQEAMSFGELLFQRDRQTKRRRWSLADLDVVDAGERLFRGGIVPGVHVEP